MYGKNLESRARLGRNNEELMSVSVPSSPDVHPAFFFKKNKKVTPFSWRKMMFFLQSQILDTKGWLKNRGNNGKKKIHF